MCNLYHQSPKEEFERWMRKERVWARMPDYGVDPVGPFGTGVFIRPGTDGELEGVLGQWGMIRPGQPERIEYKERPSKKPGGKPVKTPLHKNNARTETVASSPAFRDAWKNGRRCLIPAVALQEPNWEMSRCVWWNLRRADGLPWSIAGIWSEWTDPANGEIVPCYAMLTFNVNSHPLLSRLHRPELDPVTKKPVPLELDDKRGEAHIAPQDWDRWLHGTQEEALQLLVPPPAAMFDQADALNMDRQLAAFDAEMAAKALPPLPTQGDLW